VRDHYAEIVLLGGEVLAISQARPPQVVEFLEHTPVPFALVSDPSRAAYRAFGLKRASWSAILGWRSILGYLRLMFLGWMPRRPNEGEDVLQLGGDFVLDADGRIVYAYRSALPTDRPAVRELVEAIRAAGPHSRSECST
jgi:peroxiredoxin